MKLLELIPSFIPSEHRLLNIPLHTPASAEQMFYRQLWITGDILAGVFFFFFLFRWAHLDITLTLTKREKKEKTEVLPHKRAGVFHWKVSVTSADGREEKRTAPKQTMEVLQREKVKSLQTETGWLLFPSILVKVKDDIFSVFHG